MMPAAVDLYWIPLGAGGRYVRFNGRVFERLQATLERRSRCDLYHAAVVAQLERDRFTIELAPSPDADETSRGVVATGPVGSRHLARLRLFRYEVGCWRGGTIPDLGYAVGTPRRLTTDATLDGRLVNLVAQVPTLVWGRDELGAGEMWNSNSMIAWVIAKAGLPVSALRPPAGGRAPGWEAGLIAAGVADATSNVRRRTLHAPEAKATTCALHGSVDHRYPARMAGAAPSATADGPRRRGSGR